MQSEELAVVKDTDDALAVLQSGGGELPSRDRPSLWREQRQFITSLPSLRSRTYVFGTGAEARGGIDQGRREGAEGQRDGDVKLDHLELGSCLFERIDRRAVCRKRSGEVERRKAKTI